MKNSPKLTKASISTQKGFSTLLSLLFIVLAGSGLYLYTEKVSKEIPEVDFLSTTTQKEVKQNPDKIVKEEVKEGYDILNINYPTKLKLEKVNKNEITVSHSIPYKHTNFCDMKNGRSNSDFVDYSNKIKIVEEKYTSAIKKEYPFMVDSLIDANGNFKLQDGFLNKINIKGVDVYKSFIGVEGCGQYIYIIPFNNKTLFVENYLNPPFSYEYPYKGPFTDETINEFRNIEGVILPENSKLIFDQILSDLVTNILSNKI